MTFQTSVEAAVLRGLVSLPDPLLRRLVGPPLVLDGQTLALDTQAVLWAQKLARIPGAETVAIPEGRVVLRRQAATARGRQPVGAVREMTVAGMPARHYLPSDKVAGPGPTLLFFHGGGFLYGDLDSHDGPCRVIAEQAGVPVLAIDYGLAPENAYPGPFDDAESAYRWVLDHAAELDLDPTRLAVGGDSAGGNLAAWVAVAAARAGLPLAWQLLIYPVTETIHDTLSYRLFNEDLYLTKQFMDLVNETFLPEEWQRRDERVNLLTADLPDGLAPAYLITAGFDPLRDEGEAYAEKLRAGGVEVVARRFADQIHGFINITGIRGTSRRALDEFALQVRTVLRPHA